MRKCEIHNNQLFSASVKNFHQNFNTITILTRWRTFLLIHLSPSSLSLQNHEMACFLRPKVHDVLNCVRASSVVTFYEMIQVTKWQFSFKTFHSVLIRNLCFWGSQIMESRFSLDPDLGPALATTEVVWNPRESRDGGREMSKQRNGTPPPPPHSEDDPLDFEEKLNSSKFSASPIEENK